MIGNISKSKGFKGDRGDALTFDDLTPEQKKELSAKIISVNASVDNTTGTPSVEVTMNGTEQDRNVSLAFSGLKGEQGEKGEKGETGEKGNDGLSAYQVAVKKGFDGSEEEWLEMLGDNEKLNEHLQNVDNPHAVTAEQVGTYSKTEVDTKLDQKQDKYVDYGDSYLRINGNAKFNGEVCGTYNAETDEMSYYTGDMWKDGNDEVSSSGDDRVTWWPFIEWRTTEDYLELPIEPVNIPKGAIVRISYLFFSGDTDNTFSSRALYRFNENGKVEDIYYDYIVEIGGYDFLLRDTGSDYVEITEDILVSSVKIKAKTIGMRMAQHTLSNASGKDNFLSDSSGMLHYMISPVEYMNNLNNDKANKFYVENLEKRSSEFISETDKKIEEITTTLGTKANKSDIVSVYKFRGSVPTFNDLSDIYREEGYVYNVRDTGMNYAWNGTEWDALGGEHRDIEAHHRLDILGEQKADKSEVNTEIGKKADKLYVDESLGQITEKINRKADEDAVYPKAETYTQTEVDNKLNNKANKSDVYTKTEVYKKTETYTRTEINSKLSGYLTKYDIVNVYRFCGSVSTFDELPFDYALIPNGAPTKNGEVCGEYVEDMGDYVHFSINTTLNYGDEVLIPIKPITLKAGTYYGDINESSLGGITIESIFGNDLSVSIGDFHNMLTGYQEIEEQTVEYIKVTFPYNTEEPANYPFYVEHINTGLGALKKLADSWFNLWYGWQIPQGAYDNGAVYNVRDTGMNYAWNGTEYDALGGEHRDIEAREDIEKLEEQMGDVETALDSIITIQNELIGGSEV